MTVNTLAFTAIVLLIINPQSLFDVGFQMSFLSVLAILVFLPLFEMVFSQQYLMDHRLLKWVWSMFSISFSAQLGVAPLIAYYFGRISTISLLTNFIVIPAATLVLYLSLIVFVVPSLCFLLVELVGLLNTVLTRLSAIPGASIEGLHPSIIQTAMMYVIIAAVYLLIVKLLSLHIAKPAQDIVEVCKDH
jgi:competence protein ComEC